MWLISQRNEKRCVGVCSSTHSLKECRFQQMLIHFFRVVKVMLTLYSLNHEIIAREFKFFENECLVNLLMK